MFDMTSSSTTIDTSSTTPTTLSTDLEALAYIASNPDLIRVFGTNVEAAKSHYVDWGLSEGRTITFNAAQYLTNHSDLASVFGSDQYQASIHYIQYGHGEGRSY